jgi:nucleotide-binding universal stress UspA family protein
MSPGAAAFRRILVALDASRESRRALERSVEMATRLRAELVGLFVEDVNLLRMAAFPDTRVFAPGSSACEIDVATLERALRAAAAESRRLLETTAQRHAVPCAFRVVRGVVAAELVAGSDVGDLVIVDRRTAGASWSALLADTRGSILVLGAHTSARDGVIAVYPAERPVEEAISDIAHLAAATGRTLAVVRPSDAPADEFDRRLEDLFADRELRWEAIALPPDVEALAAVVRNRPALVIAVPSTALPIASGDEIDRLLHRAHCSMLVVR